jgi:hypothetical protein
MKKTLIALITLVSSVAFGQTKNYNTIMLKQKKDSIHKEINLHLQKAKILDGTSKTLQVAALISAVASYHIYKKEGNGNPIIFIPLSIGISSFALGIMAQKQYQKAEQKRIKFICKF